MRFGGHETFSIREGWLHKGLKLLVERPDRLVDEYAADWLGVGRNMAKSIRHWLVATELAEQFAGKKPRKDAKPKETKLGKLIYEKDPYFSEIGTWWILHVNMVNNPVYAASWSWFFNNFSLTRFERPSCIDGLSRHVQLSRGTTPKPTTLQRDINCLLTSYSRKIPADQVDPEDALECPLVHLGLMTNFRASAYYQLHQGVKDVPVEVFGYALARILPEEANQQKSVDIPISEAARGSGGPGRAFVLTSESLFELASALEAEDRSRTIQIAGLAGERMIRIPSRTPLAWAKEYYAHLSKARRSDA